MEPKLNNESAELVKITRDALRGAAAFVEMVKLEKTLKAIMDGEHDNDENMKVLGVMSELSKGLNELSDIYDKMLQTAGPDTPSTTQASSWS